MKRFSPHLENRDEVKNGNGKEFKNVTKATKIYILIEEVLKI